MYKWYAIVVYGQVVNIMFKVQYDKYDIVNFYFLDI